VWDAFLATAPLPAVAAASAWGGESVVHRDFLSDPYGNGWHVDRPGFDRMLQDAARTAGVRVELGATLAGCAHAPRGWHLTVTSCAGTSTLGARFVVDASGRARSFARRVGVGEDRHDAMVACFTYLETPPDAVVETVVEAVRDGWWYAAPVPGRSSVVAFLTDVERVSHGRDRDLAATIPPAIAARVPPVARGVRLRKVIADSSRLRLAAAPGWIAVGDAAAAHDPLAAQGIDRALRSGLRAAQAVSLALHDRPGALRTYADLQRASFDDYVRLRRRFYALEPRWRGAAFWSRRTQTADRTHPARSA
jgi:flavin-dependent dehydrogenase